MNNNNIKINAQLLREGLHELRYAQPEIERIKRNLNEMHLKAIKETDEVADHVAKAVEKILTAIHVADKEVTNDV